MYRFMQDINRKHNLQLKVPSPPSTTPHKRPITNQRPQTFRDLHAFSLSNRSAFWSHLFDAANLIHEGSYTTVVDESLPIDAVPRWFDGVWLNFAENALFSRARDHTNPAARCLEEKEDAKVTITEVREGGSEVRSVTYGELREMAGRMAKAMRARGVGKGDRVVIVGANSVETAVVWLGAAWVGAVFSSSSTDMGVKGILQRAVQVNPKVSFWEVGWAVRGHADGRVVAVYGRRGAV
jgi:acetoacetyl-CoA synthetase